MRTSRHFGKIPVHLPTKRLHFLLFFSPRKTKFAGSDSFSALLRFYFLPTSPPCRPPPQIHPWTITPLFMIHFENKLHLFWQMLVLGQRPEPSLIFFGIVTQDSHFVFFLLCCQTNKIAHLAHGGIIIFLQGDTMLNLFLVFGEKRFRTLNHLSNDQCARSAFVCAARTLLLVSNAAQPGLPGLPGLQGLFSMLQWQKE